MIKLNSVINMMKNDLLASLLFLLLLLNPLQGYTQTEGGSAELFQQTESLSEHDYFDEFAAVAPWSEHAADEPDQFQAKFFHMLFILALLIGFMILASWALKRMMKARITQVNQTSLIKVLETRQLSPKTNLFLIEIEGKMLLIGESPTTVSHIATFLSKE